MQGCCRARKANPYLQRIGRCPLQATGLIKAAMLPELGHGLAAASLAKGVLVFCRRCGCYSQHRVRALGHACPGLRQTGQAKALRAGRHPTTKEVFLGRPWKLWARGAKVILPLVEEDPLEVFDGSPLELGPVQELAGDAFDEEQEAADFLQFGA